MMSVAWPEVLEGIHVPSVAVHFDFCHEKITEICNIDSCGMEKQSEWKVPVWDPIKIYTCFLYVTSLILYIYCECFQLGMCLLKFH